MANLFSNEKLYFFFPKISVTSIQQLIICHSGIHEMTHQPSKLQLLSM